MVIRCFFLHFFFYFVPSFYCVLQVNFLTTFKKKKNSPQVKNKMKSSDFKLLISAVVFIFLNVILLLIYFEIVMKEDVPTEIIDVIFVAKGRRRAQIQHKLWMQHWTPLQMTHFFVVHLKGVDDADDTNPGLAHFKTDFETESEVFLNIADIVSSKNAKFLWASDTVIPLADVKLRMFQRNSLGWRFFSGFNPDAILFGISDFFEKTIPVTLLAYEKLVFETYEDFELYFISGKHNVYSNMAQNVVLPNSKNKMKARMKNELFQVVHINPNTEFDIAELNSLIQKTWQTYLK